MLTYNRSSQFIISIAHLWTPKERKEEKGTDKAKKKEKKMEDIALSLRRTLSPPKRWPGSLMPRRASSGLFKTKFALEALRTNRKRAQHILCLLLLVVKYILGTPYEPFLWVEHLTTFFLLLNNFPPFFGSFFWGEGVPWRSFPLCPLKLLGHPKYHYEEFQFATTGSLALSGKFGSVSPK